MIITISSHQRQEVQRISSIMCGGEEGFLYHDFRTQKDPNTVNVLSWNSKAEMLSAGPSVTVLHGLRNNIKQWVSNCKDTKQAEHSSSSQVLKASKTGI